MPSLKLPCAAHLILKLSWASKNSLDVAHHDFPLRASELGTTFVSEPYVKMSFGKLYGYEVSQIQTNSKVKIAGAQLSWAGKVPVTVGRAAAFVLLL